MVPRMHGGLTWGLRNPQSRFGPGSSPSLLSGGLGDATCRCCEIDVSYEKFLEWVRLVVVPHIRDAMAQFVVFSLFSLLKTN